MGIVKITSVANQIDEFESVTIIGDPGCDGLGAATMNVFANALTAISSDMTIIAGDIVHNGIRPLYSTVSSFVNSVSKNNVYMLCGNHDTAWYDEYFGLRNYFLYNSRCLFIILDNSSRSFENNALDTLETALRDYRRENIVILFHYPPPNSICSNSVNAENWQKILSVIEPYKENIRMTLSGHVHSYFEDVVDGIRVIVTGGGGARIEHVNAKIDPVLAHHHIVKLYFDESGILRHQHVALESRHYTIESDKPELRLRLETTLANESVAHVRYMLFAEDAMEKGLKGLAKMFRAFAESEFHHARNHMFVLNELGTTKDNIDNAYRRECEEVDKIYKEDLDFCRSGHYGLSEYVFYDSIEAEKIHRKQLENIISSYENNTDIPEKTYHVCRSCGFTFAGSEKPRVCPVCGAPHDLIIEIQ